MATGFSTDFRKKKFLMVRQSWGLFKIFSFFPLEILSERELGAERCEAGWVGWVMK